MALPAGGVQSKDRWHYLLEARAGGMRSGSRERLKRQDVLPADVHLMLSKGALVSRGCTSRKNRW